MAEVIRVNFSEIMQSIEVKLGAISIITWAVNDHVPQLVSGHDILLRARSATPIPYDGGSWDLRVSRFIDIILRTQSIKDSGGNNKGWLIDHFAMADKILDLLMNDDEYGTFWPTDENGNFLTTKAVDLAKDVPPERRSDSSAWGDSICTLEIHYMPKVVPKGP